MILKRPTAQAGSGRGVGDVLLSVPFGHSDRPQLLRTCYTALTTAGLVETRALMFTFAINVGLVNSLQHGGGHGQVNVVHYRGGQIVAEIIDPGQRADWKAEATASTEVGSGLWLAERMVDDLTLESGPRGSTLRLVVAVGGGIYPWVGSRHDANLADLIATILFSQ